MLFSGCAGTKRRPFARREEDVLLIPRGNPLFDNVGFREASTGVALMFPLHDIICPPLQSSNIIHPAELFYKGVAKGVDKLCVIW